MQGLRLLLAAVLLSFMPGAAQAQTDEWFLGTHPEYHAAMIRQIDEFFIAIFIPKEPTAFGPAILMETVAPTCDTKRPIEMHSTRSIDTSSHLPEERLRSVRDTVSEFYENSIKPCAGARDLEAKLFHRFDDAYRAMDALLIEAEFFPLSPDVGSETAEPAAEQEDGLN